MNQPIQAPQVIVVDAADSHWNSVLEDMAPTKASRILIRRFEFTSPNTNILNRFLREYGLSYEVFGDNVLLMAAPPPPNLEGLQHAL